MEDQGRELKILIVDDSFEDREILKRYLKTINDYHIETMEARNVKEALGMIQEHSLDLLFVDFNMPGASGLDLIKSLQKNSKFEFPIIMLTGEGSENIAVTAMKMGIGDYLIKDEINSNSIRMAVIGTIDRFRMECFIETQKQLLEVAARTDGLTGLWNRRYFDEQIEIEMERAHRYGLMLSLVIADLDLFKKVNDTHGHLVGDSVLIGFSKVLKQGLRLTDFAARFGGEEFCIILPNIDYKSTLPPICRLASTMREKPFRNDRGDVFHVTASFGIVQYSNEFKSLEMFIEAADSALYHAKKIGRDKVVLLTPEGDFEIGCEKE